MISDEDVERALDHLRDSATKAARARAERAYIEEFRKTMKAQIMKEHATLPLGAQEREAYDDARYRQHLEALKEAVYADEYHRFMREAANAKIEAWRTQCSNERAKL
jgi:chromosome segregation ATPase